jgi:hypothetical protein
MVKKKIWHFFSYLPHTVLIPFKTAAYINYNTKIRVMTDPEPQYIKKNPKDEKKTVIK